MKSKILKIAVSGALGKMGKNLISEIQNTKNISLKVAIVKEKSPYITQDVGKIIKIGKINVPISDSLKNNLQKFNILIDFTNPKTTLENLNICAKEKKKCNNWNNRFYSRRTKEN